MTGYIHNFKFCKSYLWKRKTAHLALKSNTFLILPVLQTCIVRCPSLINWATTHNKAKDSRTCWWISNNHVSVWHDTKLNHFWLDHRELFVKRVKHAQINSYEMLYVSYIFVVQCSCLKKYIIVRSSVSGILLQTQKLV